MQNQKPTAVAEWSTGARVRTDVRAVYPRLHRSVVLVVPGTVVEFGTGGVEPHEVGMVDASSPLEELRLPQGRGRSA